MRKYFLYILSVILLSMTLISCGPSTQDIDDKPAQVDSNVLQRNQLVFDSYAGIIPAPNDIMWKDSNGFVYFDPDSTEDIPTKLLYTAINSLQIKGFSPATPIAIPLVNDIELTNLEDNYLLIDLTDLQTKVIDACGGLANTTCLTNNFLSNTSDINEKNKVKIMQTGNEIKLYPIEPLDAGHQYLVVLENNIVDINGNPLLTTPVFESLKSSDNLTDPDLESLRQNYLQIWELLENFYYLSKDDILEFFTFTTADKTLSIENFAYINQLGLEIMQNNLSVKDAETLISDNISVNNLPYVNVPLELSGVIQNITNDTNLSPLFTTCAGINTDNKTITTYNLSTQNVEQIPYLISPNTDNNSVIIFQHGYTSKKEAALLLAGYLNNLNNYPTIAIDLPYHGERTPNGETSGESYITANIPQTRINFVQSVLDLTFLYNYLKNGCIDINSDNITDKPTHIYYIGQSMGSIIGSMFASYPANNLEKIVFNVGGANLSALLDTSQDMSDFLNSVLEEKGITKESAEYYGFLGLVQLLMDPADPIYVADNLSDKTMIQTAFKDTFVTNISNEILAHKLGFDSHIDITDFQNDNNTISPSNKWYQFGGTITKIAHGFLLYYPAYLSNQLTNSYTQDDLDASDAALKQIGFYLN